MNKYYFSLLLVLLIVPGVSGHGDSHPTDSSNSDNILSLEFILLITAAMSITFLAILTRLIGLKDKRLIFSMLISSLIFLGLDYYYLKFYYFA